MATPAATVHTKAIQIVLEPIADTIGHMIILCNEAEETSKGMPDFTTPCENISAAVMNFVEIGREDLDTTPDLVLKAEMSAACQQAEAATRRLTSAAELLKADNMSAVGRKALTTALTDVLMGSQAVLIANDDSEVRMVVEAAQSSKGALVLVDEVRDENDLLAIQESLSRRLIQTCRRVDRRMEDLFEQRHKDRLANQVVVIKGQTPLLFSAMKTKASNLTVTSAAINQKLVIKQLDKALSEIIELVEMRVYLPNWADGMGKLVEKFRMVQAALAKIDPTSLSPLEFSKTMAQLDELIANAEQWLNDPSVSKENKGALLVKLKEVKLLKKELKAAMAELVKDPNNIELQRRVASKKAELEKAMRELQLAETAAALEGLIQVFADPKLSTVPLVKAAKSKNAPEFVKESKEFMALNKEMVDRTKEVAEYIEDPDKAAAIRTAAKHNEEVLLPSVLHAGRVVLENPNDEAAKQHLDKMAKQWENAKNKLEQDVFEAVDPVAFTRATKAVFEKNLKDMRDAIENQDEEAFLRTRARLDHIAKEAIRHARREAANTDDPVMKQMYLDAADNMERMLPNTLADADAAFAANDAASLAKFDKSAKELLDGADGAAKAAYYPTAEAERIAAEAERIAAEKAAAEAKILAAQNEAERAARVEAEKAARAAAAARIAKENEFKPTTAVGETAIGLRNEVNKWEAEGNTLVGHALKMTDLTKLLGEYNERNDKAGMIKTAKTISKEAESAAKEAMLLCAQCTDKRLQNQLRVLAEKLPTQAMQLKIIASVKAANPDDQSADEQMVVCARALMQTMEEMMRAVAAASIRLTADAKGKAMAAVWKQKLDAYANSSPVPLVKIL